MFKVRIRDVTEAFTNTKSKLVLSALSQGKKAYAVCLPKLKGLLGFELGPNRRIGTELADVAKRFGLKGLLHSDELPKYGITQEEVNKIRKLLGCSENDAFIVILVENYEKAKIVFQYIIERLNLMIKTIPKDTRQVNKDGTTSFLRPQPGSARMYPETDHPLIYVDKEEKEYNNFVEVIYHVRYGDEEFSLSLAKLKQKDIDLYFKLKEKYFVLNKLDPEFRKFILEKLGFNKKQIEDVLWSEFLDFFEDNAKRVKPSLLYYLVFMLSAEAKKEFGEDLKIDKRFLDESVDLLARDMVTKDALKHLLRLYNRYKKPLELLAKENNLLKIKDKEVLKKRVKELIEKYKDLPEKKRLNEILKELRIVAEPKEIISIYKEII